MSEEAGERRGAWVDPRFRDVVAQWGAMRVERRPGGRTRRVCPHGFGVTAMVNLKTRAVRNVQCGACFPEA